MTIDSSALRSFDRPSAPVQYQILVVDDDVKFCRLLKAYLEPMGYRISAIHKGNHVLQMVRTHPFHAVILDIMLPGDDGFDILRDLRRESNIPVLILTARGEETDRIVGLEMGADDYLPKTFSNRELLARLRAVVRRYMHSSAKRRETPANDVIVSGPLWINTRNRTAKMDGRVLDLTPLEYDLLSHLAGNAGKVLTRDQLLDSATGRNYCVFDRSIDVHISSLRRKLGDNPRSPKWIKTVRSVGYMFNAAAGDAP